MIQKAKILKQNNLDEKNKKKNNNKFSVLFNSDSDSVPKVEITARSVDFAVIAIIIQALFLFSSVLLPSSFRLDTQTPFSHVHNVGQ